MAPKGGNVLPMWGNERTMNLNPLILTNIQASQYFKVKLFEVKSYHGVIDEIYYNVDHLEPWERGSRRTAGQTGMCGGVRGVGAGGIVSTAYCILYKLYTLKLTKKQVVGLLNHGDSPYIRGLGFMYIRYTQPPQDLFSWFEDYLDDDEEIDVKAGGGNSMTVGEMCRQMLTKLEWYSTMFPRIPVPIQKEIEYQMAAYGPAPLPEGVKTAKTVVRANDHIPDNEVNWGEAEKQARMIRERVGEGSREGSTQSSHRRSPPPRSSSRGRSPHRSPRDREASPWRNTNYSRDDRNRSTSPKEDRVKNDGPEDCHRQHKSKKHKHKHHHKHGDRRRSRSRSRSGTRDRKRKSDRRSRSRSYERQHKSRNGSHREGHSRHRSRSYSTERR